MDETECLGGSLRSLLPLSREGPCDDPSAELGIGDMPRRGPPKLSRRERPDSDDRYDDMSLL